MNLSLRHLFIAFATVLTFTTVTRAQTYTYLPDSTFDGDGLKGFIFFNNIDRLFGAALQPDEKVLLAGMSKNNTTGNFEMGIVRLKVDGSFDSTFSGDGVAYLSMGAQGAIGGLMPKVKVAPNGKIIVVNSGQLPSSSGQDILVCRLDSNGVLDPTFNGTGSLYIDMTGTSQYPDAATDFDFDANGNIYVVGMTRNGPSPLNNEIAVVKIDTNGVLVPSFDGDGKKLYNPTTFVEFGRGIRVQADGKIVVGATAGNNMHIMRIDSTGALDLSFNTTGMTTVTFQLAADMGALELDGNGKIVIAGQLQTSNSNIAVARYNSNGTFDAGFGFNGKYTYNVGGGANSINSIYIQSDNKIVMGGFADDSLGFSKFIATRVDTAGTIDLTFNGLGFVQQRIINGNLNEECGGMAVMNDGRIILAGTSIYSSAINEDAAVCRLLPTLLTGLSAVGAEANLQAYPNPSSGVVQVMSKMSGTATLSDVAGRTLQRVQLLAGYNTIDLSVFPAGMYFLGMEKSPALKLILQ